MQHYEDSSDGRGEVALSAGERKEVHSAVLLKQLDVFDMCWDDTKSCSSGQRLVLQVWLSFECLHATCLYISQFELENWTDCWGFLGSLGQLQTGVSISASVRAQAHCAPGKGFRAGLPNCLDEKVSGKSSVCP